MLLQDRVAFVTGAGGGLGRAISVRFAAHGAAVILGDLDLAAAESVQREIGTAGGRALAVQLDVTGPESVAAAVEQTIGAFEHIDILVNNAGICPLRRIEDITLEEWNRVLAVNLTGAFLCAQAMLPYLKQSSQGRVINIGSLAGRIGGIAAGAHYSVSKAGIICLTKVLAKALAPYGATSNCISPGTTETEMTAGWDEQTKAGIMQTIPLRRFGQPDDVASAALYYASSDAAYVTGTTLDLTGGALMI
jgi:NAD(P)-dependent dehydrogenase (short-subunit alcohol dehydrogenase family)